MDSPLNCSYNLLLISPPFPCSSDMIRETDSGRYGTLLVRPVHNIQQFWPESISLPHIFCILDLCFTVWIFAERVLRDFVPWTCWSSLVLVPGLTPEVPLRCSSSGSLSLLPRCRRGAHCSSSSSLGSAIDFPELLGDFKVFWNAISAILVTYLIASTVERPFQKSNW